LVRNEQGVFRSGRKVPRQLHQDEYELQDRPARREPSQGVERENGLTR
jgi:hypothetical protein